MHTAKLVLALAGVLVFFVGAKLGLEWLRWAGIALVAIAWFLRFYRSRRAPDQPPAAQSP
ncbi:MAG: hypothetical protein KF689_06210 [Gemmatimonadaceae bacterium]|nr:hypothetical protein [Gemmatimonadaceae bacterium]